LNIIGEETAKLPGANLRNKVFRNGSSSWVNYCPHCTVNHYENYLLNDVTKGRITKIKEISRLFIDLRCEECGMELETIADRYSVICENCARPLISYAENEVKNFVIESSISELTELLRVLSFERSLLSTGSTSPDDALNSIQEHIIIKIRNYRALMGNVKMKESVIIDVKNNGDSERSNEGLEVTDSNQKISHINKSRIKFPNAYKPWSPEDDRKLTTLFTNGEDIITLSKTFERKPGAIRSRLSKFNLIDPLNDGKNDKKG